VHPILAHSIECAFLLSSPGTHASTRWRTTNPDWRHYSESVAGHSAPRAWQPC